jgi:hypothetical protein
MPVFETTPDGTAKPCRWVSRSTSPSSAPPLHAHRPQLWINGNAVHRREIDDDTIVAQGPAGDVVTAAFDSDKKIVRARKLHRPNNVHYTRTAGDQAGMLIDARIPYPPSRSIASVAR